MTLEKLVEQYGHVSIIREAGETRIGVTHPSPSGKWVEWRWHRAPTTPEALALVLAKELTT